MRTPKEQRKHLRDKWDRRIKKMYERINKLNPPKPDPEIEDGFRRNMEKGD